MCGVGAASVDIYLAMPSDDDESVVCNTDVAMTDSILSELSSLQASLPKTTKPTIPALIKLFEEFRKQLVSDFASKADAAVKDIKDECLAVCKTKDTKISLFESTIHRLEDQLDAAEAYGRKDSHNIRLYWPCHQ